MQDALMEEIPENNRFVRGLLAYAGFKQVGGRTSGRSAWGAKLNTPFASLPVSPSTGHRFLDLPASHRDLSGVANCHAFLLGSFLILGFRIFGYAPGDTPGLAPLAVEMFFLGGVTLVILGIIGENLGRFYYEVKRRPRFLIESVDRWGDGSGR